MDLTIRKLDANEVDKVSHLYDEVGNPSFMENRKNNIISGVQDIYVLEGTDNIIGEVTVIYVDDRENYTISNKRVYMEALRIEKKEQGKGFGQFFVSAVIEEIKSAGYKEITIGVEDDNLNAKHLYNKLGFTNFISREKGLKYAPNGYALIMKVLDK